jgi:putative restriction endonuclease
MKAYIGITDFDWFDFLSGLGSLDEVNFWQPGGHRVFKALNPGELFLFKLHSPHNFIVGGGFFAHSSIIPMSLAWESFKEKNGAATFNDMRERIKKLRHNRNLQDEDYNIGCIILEQPFFFERDLWIPSPADWKPNIVQGKTYDLQQGHGKVLFETLQKSMSSDLLRENIEVISGPKYGSPTTILPRLGQGSFRVLVTDAYKRKCAITGERTLPALEAAHIKSYSKEGLHQVDNGLLLRSDIHRLFDRGYVTVTADFRFEVSKRIKKEFENGHEYYDLHGKEIYIPENQYYKPNRDSLRWHNEEVFLG